MSPLSTLGSRQFQAPALAASSHQTHGKSPTGTPERSALSALNPVSLSQKGIELSAQGMAKRAEELGEATLDLAQNFISNFAQQMFGDAAKGATLSFDTASLSAQSGFTAMAQHSEGSNGISDRAAFSLNDSSHFIGKGKITLADGQTFEFEIEVQYQSRIEAATTRTTSTTGAGAKPDQSNHGRGALPTARVPDVDFPGGLDELFKLLGRQLQIDLPAQKQSADTDAEKAGTLSLRLLKLISDTTVLDQVPAKDQRAKALADAYGALPVVAAGAAPALPAALESTASTAAPT
jgi:hypothetical protein